MEILGKELVEELFGAWPSFHDAEVVSVELQREEPGYYAKLRASINVCRSSPKNVGTAEFEMQPTHDAVISFEFSGVESLSLEGFNHQNVIDDLSITEEGGLMNVVFESIYGVQCSFVCRSAMVSSVVNRLSVGG